MWEYNYSDELYHHGVKGMKWGVRKARYRSGAERARIAYRLEELNRVDTRNKSRLENKKKSKNFMANRRLKWIVKYANLTLPLTTERECVKQQLKV